RGRSCIRSSPKLYPLHSKWFIAAVALVTCAACREPAPQAGSAPVEKLVPTYNAAGALTKLDADSDHDGLIDMWAYMDGARVVRVEVDENGDGKIDKGETYSDGSLSTMAIDTTRRGRADRRLVYRPDGTLD